ncbi:methylmalonyl-CoA mutase [Nakamurella antarctica]|uniref:Methylmalonyl-CoA mutase n=1 Tax=Nakamurella antarctica TaxID=1902245 RepID=A0A3G8ZML0_9ACTN|nr:methylmalonyl-CoA mutase family protein [Nakamurella antarctica]AZI58559.1 methylmalonyl-CoA mutase [Nakamurella antarctica]
MDALSEELPLLGNTAVPTRQGWDAAAAAVLRKAGRLAADASDSLALASLSRRSEDGIVVPALGTAESAAGLPELGLPGHAPFTRGSAAPQSEETTADGWDIRTYIAESDPAAANRIALLDLRGGAVSLWLRVGATGTDIADLATVLDGVYLDFGPVVFDCDDDVDPVAVAVAFDSILTTRVLRSAPTSNLGADPLASLVRSGGVDPGCAATASAAVSATIGEVGAIAARLGTRGVVVDATAVHDAGATDAQELGYSLAAGTLYLRALVDSGIDVNTAACLIEFRYAATDNQFLTIAKLRAARTLWHRVCELSGVVESARGQLQHVVTSRPMMTRYDPWVNILRTTIAAFAASIGGAAAITVLPFDDALGEPNTLARRIARNTSAVLISESHIAKVTDPAGGAYAVEELTDATARAGWAQFQLIEESDGVVAALADGSLAARVHAAAVARSADIARRKRPLTGVSEFPLTGEQLLDRNRPPTSGTKPRPGALPAIRYAEEFEEMRDAPCSGTLFLATLGSVAQHTARATFVANLCAAGGITVDAAGTTATPADVVAAFTRSGAGVVAVTGTDAAYVNSAVDVIAGLRAAGATWIILAGRPSEDLAPLVDDWVAAGVDALAFLHRTRAHLQETT